MSEKPETLRLADILEEMARAKGLFGATAAAAELRRLHDECEALRAALATGLEMTQELLAMKREALGNDYQRTRAYVEAEREIAAAMAKEQTK